MTRPPVKRFADRVTIVTGASSGLGLAVARAFSLEGARVVLVARNLPRLQQIATELNALPVACDVSRRDEVTAMVEKTIATFGRVDILVSNAGIGLIAPVERVEMPDARAVVDTNFFGAFNCIQAVLPHMQRQRSGHIVNVTAVGGGLRAVPNSAVYGATKAALVALADALRIEVRPFGIGVTTFCPGLISDTNFFASVKSYGPVQFWKLPDQITSADAAQALLNGVTRRKRLVLVTRTAHITYFLSRFFPKTLDRILAKRMPKPSCES